ncbi:MBL fold metallo-hydrolase [Paeniglutamicibacter quisquiliarum]|uniref:MBL fold metallo-hydrolase n=1 Tax=Paeniglutamicibacter quisquiliarum TaxID=2849498 RepID=UPI0020C48AA0|nr:MBL fold metallo-hydrolase [Paeniglutamicibacter quisquiliarum]
MSWVEVAADVFVKRYEAGDVNVVAILGPQGVTVIDTRGSPAEAQEIVDDVAERFGMPIVGAVNTHAHYDHSFGNSVFADLGVPVIGHHRIPDHYAALEGPRLRAWQADPAGEPDKKWDHVVLTQPTVLIQRSTTLTASGRDIELIPISRGHTDTDLVVCVPDAGVWALGDAIEESGPPMFGSGCWPLEWPAALDEVLLRVQPGDVVVPGHGRVVDREFAARQAIDLHAVADAIRDAHTAGTEIGDAAGLPWPTWMLRSAFEQGFPQLR